jgi:hypothetical protein
MLKPGESASTLAPVQDFIAELHARVSAMSGGKVADYIPELGKADPATFGIALATGLTRSVRGIKVCQDISNEFELHAFNNRTNVRSVIRRFYRGDRVRSSRLRTAEERDLLEAQGAKTAVIETQGALFFGSTEQLLRGSPSRERALRDRRFQARPFWRRSGARVERYNIVKRA